MSSAGAAQLHIAAVTLHGGDFTALNDAIQAQTRLPDSIIELSAEDYAGPQDLSRSLRSNLLTDRKNAKQTRTAGPGGVPSTSLWRTLERQLGEGFTPRYQWLWILPAGGIPEPDALRKLEDRVFTVKDELTHDEIGIVGAKQVHADDPHRLVNLGLRPLRSGEVITGTEPRELDQGQYDGQDEVPAVSAQGMLVRARLFGDLGGFDPALTGDYAAAQFCDQARQAGARAVVESAARVRRADPPRRDLVHRLAGTLWLPSAQRKDQIRARLGAASALALPLLWLGQWVVALLRTIALFVCKAPDAALLQLGATASALLNLPAVAHVRSFSRAARRAVAARAESPEAAKQQYLQARTDVRANRLPSSAVRAQRRRDVTAETVDGQHTRHSTAAVADLGAAEPGSGDGEFDQMPARRSEDRLGLFLVLTVLTGVSLVGFRELLTAGALSGGAALPVSESLAEVWHHTTSFLVADSLGERAAADPFALVLLVLSLVSVGHASAVLLWITILAAPLSALTAWWAAGRFSSRGFHRVLAALIWGLLPALHTSVGQGRIGSVIVHILLPVLVLSAVRAVADRRRAQPGTQHRVASLRLARGWETAAAAALLLAVITAAAPILLLPAVIACAAAPLAAGRPARVLWLVPIPALAIFAPMLISALDRGANLAAVLLAEPGRAVGAAEAGDPAPVWQQLLGFSQSFTASAGLPGASHDGSVAWLPEMLDGSFWSLRLALLIGGPLLLIALVALLAAGRRGVVLTCGLIGLGTLAFSGLATKLTAGQSAGELVPANPAPLVSAVVLCLLIATLSALDVSRHAGSALGGLFAPVSATLLVLAIFTTGVFWAAPRMLASAGLADQTVTAVNSESVLISPGSPRSLPATAADQGAGPAATRTLVLASGPDGVTAEVVSRYGRTLDKARTASAAQDLPLLATDPAGPLGSGEPVAEDLSDSSLRLAELIAALVSPGSEHVTGLMQELGIGHVLVTAGSGLAEAADTAGGLVRVGETDHGALWRAEPPAQELPAGPGLSGTATVWARIVDDQGELVALLPSAHHQVDTDLTEITDAEGQPLSLDPETDYYLEIASERARGWHASLNAERLVTVTADRLDVDPEEMPWLRQYYLPAQALDDSAAELSLGHRSDLQYPILLGAAGLLVLFVLIAVPLPRSWRILEVRQGRSGARPAGRGGPEVSHL